MQFPARIPFIEKLGIELLRFDGGEAELAVDTADDLCNSWGVAHGGVVMTLLDVAMAHAARSPLPPDANRPPEQEVPEGRGVATIEMKTSFMRPGQGRLVAKAKVLHRTAATVFCEAAIVDAAGQLVAHATGTFKCLKGLPAAGRQIMRPNASD